MVEIYMEDIIMLCVKTILKIYGGYIMIHVKETTLENVLSQTPYCLFYIKNG